MFRSKPRLHPGLFLLLGLSLWVTVAAGTTPPSRQQTIRQINSLLHQDRRSEALSLCRQYTKDYPADAQVLYNLACLENTVGDRDRAEAAYVAALRAGFGDFELAATDPDLQGDLHQVIVRLNAAEQERLAALAARQALTLDLGVWSPSRQLIPHDPLAEANPIVVSSPTLRLRWQETGLELEADADSSWAAALAGPGMTPWQGGPGLMLSLSIPDSTSAWESANHFLFSFGLDRSGMGGAMFVASQRKWQPISDLEPKIKSTVGGGIRFSAFIPWTAIMPFDPVVDTPLGINATLVVPTGPARRRASLVETMDTVKPLARRRRFALLNFNTDSISADRFVGKVSESISRTLPLDLDLVAVSTMSGRATLSLNFMDQAGRSVLPGGPLTADLTLEQGTNRLRRQADFSSLRAGAYLLQAKLEFPSGKEEAWGASVLHLPPGWRDTYQEHMALVAHDEQATVNYLWDSITRAVAAHQPRRSPGAIVTTLLELDRMLAAAEENGSILPDKGTMVMVYPGPQGQDRVCRLYLPAGREHADGLNPILILGHGWGLEAQMAARIGRNYEFGDQKPTLKVGEDDRFPVYLVPELQPDRNDPGDNLLAEAAACQSWARDYFHSSGVSLVGVDNLGATALALARQHPRAITALQIYAGSHLEPWPQAQPEFIRRQLGPPVSTAPITWVDFRTATARAGQARAILQALKDLGYPITAEQEALGSPGLTQVADRTVKWAEGLR